MAISSCQVVGTARRDIPYAGRYLEHFRVCTFVLSGVRVLLRVDQHTPLSETETFRTRPKEVRFLLPLPVLGVPSLIGYPQA